MQLLKQWHRDGEDDDVGSDVDTGVGEPKLQAVHAVALDSLVPEGGDGYAHKDGADDGPEAVDDKDAEHDVAEAVDQRGGEDALVLEDDGELREDERRVVAWDCSPEALYEGWDILRRDRGKRRAEAIFNFYYTNQHNSLFQYRLL